jgi:hypothetical protein
MLSELASGEGSIAESLKKLVKEINIWGATKAAIGVGVEFIPGGGALKGLIDKLPEGTKTNNEYEQFIKVKKDFDKSVVKYLTTSPNGRVFIYIDDIDRCEPITSVYVLRAIQVLCRTKGCVFILGLDRDVIVKNLIEVYKDTSFAKEYLDKVVQLHIELPPLKSHIVQNAILYKHDGTARKGIEPFVDWIAEYMDYNPRKIERFIYLYDFKLTMDPGKPNFHFYRQTVLLTAWELRWPELASEIARARNEVFTATESLQQADNEEIEMGIVKSYAHLPIIGRIQSDRLFLHSFREIYGIKP